MYKMYNNNTKQMPFLIEEERRERGEHQQRSQIKQKPILSKNLLVMKRWRSIISDEKWTNSFYVR